MPKSIAGPEDGKVRMDRNNRETVLFFTMALVGGLLAGFSVVRSGLLSSAETMNLITIVSSLLSRDLHQLALRLGVALFFALSIAAATLLKNDRRIQLWAILVDILGVLIVGLIPGRHNSVAVLYPLFFACGLQWCAFPGARGYTSSCVFSTNNFRQLMAGLTGGLSGQDPDGFRRARFFGTTLLLFHIGVASALWLGRVMDGRSIWFTLVPLGCALRLCLLKLRGSAE